MNFSQLTLLLCVFGALNIQAHPLHSNTTTKTGIIHLNKTVPDTSKKLRQNIQFSLGKQAFKTLNNAAFVLKATGGGSGNPIIFTSSDTSVAVITGKTVSLINTGKTIITAQQAGNKHYYAANPVKQILTIHSKSIGQSPHQLKLVTHHGVLKLTIQGGNPHAYTSITISDKQGIDILLTSKYLKNGQLDIPIVSLPSGQYSVNIEIGSKVFIRKLNRP